MADASVKLSERFPDSSVLTELAGQLKDGVGGIKPPSFATDKITSLAGSFKLPIPDTSGWQAAIPSDAGKLMDSFPNPAELAKPFTDPIDTVKEIFTFDFSKIQQNQPQSAPTQAPDLSAQIEALAGPVDDLTKLITDPEVGRILDVLTKLTGAESLQNIGQQTQQTASQIKTVIHDHIEGIALAFASVLSVHSSQETLQGRVSAVAATFSPDATVSRLQAVLDAYGGSVPLAAVIMATNPSDATVLDALRSRLQSVNSAFQNYVTNLARDMAVTETALATLDAADLSAQWDTIKAAVSKVNWTAAAGMGKAVEEVVQEWRSKLTVTPPFTMDEYRQAINIGLANVEKLIASFDPSQITNSIQNVVKTALSPFEKVEEFKTQVETIVRGALGTVSDAIQQINLKPLMDTIKQALATLSNSLKQISDLLAEVRNSIQGALDSVKSALDGVKNFILDPQNGLKKKIEDVFNSITTILDDLKIQDVTKEITALLDPVNDALAKIQFQPIINAVLSAINTIVEVLKKVGPLLVTDALKQKLADAAKFLNQIDFGKIGDELNATFDDILKSVDQDALGEFQAEYEKAVDGLKKLDPEPALHEVQTEVFDPLLAELQKVHPSDLLKPIGEAFDAAHQELAKFDPGETLAFITKFFADLIAKIDSISPAKLLAPVQEMLDDLHKKIDSLLHIDAIVAAFEKFKAWAEPVSSGLDFSGPLLDSFSSGFAQMRGAIANFDPEVFMRVIANMLDGLLAKFGLRINVEGLVSAISSIVKGPEQLGGKLAEMQNSLFGLSGRINGVDAQAALTTLRTRYGEVKAAVSTKSGLPGDIVKLAAALDPMPVLAPMLPKIDRVKGVAAAAGSKFSQMVAPLSALSDSLGGALALLQSLLSPANLLRDALMAPLQGLFPGQKFSGPQELLVHFLDQFDPEGLKPALQTLFQTIEAKLKSLLDKTILDPLGEVINTIKGATGILDIHDLIDTINGVFKNVEDVIKSLDPTPIIQEIEADYKQITSMLDQVNPSQFIQEVAKIYEDDIIGTVKNISPETLLVPPLRDLFQKIAGALGAFNIEAIFKPVLDRLKTLDDDLGGGLHQVEDSWKQMLAVLASSTGGSVSGSVSVQAG
jgi:hypothetical protein